MKRITDEEQIRNLWQAEQRELERIRKSKDMPQASIEDLMRGSAIGSLMGDKYVPSALLLNIIHKYGKEHNGISVDRMINTATFSIRDLWFGMAGITLGTHVLLLKSYVQVHETIVNQYGVVNPTLPGLIYHEMIHVSQVLDDGKAKFLFKYLWQWVKSGFSYKKMCNIGYEKQAYAAQFDLINKIVTQGISDLL